MKKRYPVTSPIRFNGVDYAEGSKIDLEDTEVDDLHTAGVIDLEAEDIVAAKAPTDDAERIAAVVAAIGQLNTANPGQWLQNGKPKADALSEITGWPVTAADRDAAWATGAGQA